MNRIGICAVYKYITITISSRGDQNTPITTHQDSTYTNIWKSSKSWINYFWLDCNTCFPMDKWFIFCISKRHNLLITETTVSLERPTPVYNVCLNRVSRNAQNIALRDVQNNAVRNKTRNTPPQSTRHHNTIKPQQLLCHTQKGSSEVSGRRNDSSEVRNLFRRRSAVFCVTIFNIFVIFSRCAGPGKKKKKKRKQIEGCYF